MVKRPWSNLKSSLPGANLPIFILMIVFMPRCHTERALEAVEKGWVERPWADQRDGWEGFVMLFTPQTMDELDVTFQLIIE